MTIITPEQEESLRKFEREHKDRCKRIMERYEKPPLKKEKHIHKVWTKKELLEFQSWGCEVKIVDNSNQNKLF
jgi:hypothetical protein